MNKCLVCWRYVCICGKPAKKKPLASVRRQGYCLCGNLLTIVDSGTRCRQCVLQGEER